MKYWIDNNGDRLDVIYGYDDNLKKAGSMGDVLFPFPGRVENSQYDFAGQHYELKGVRIKNGHALHGFAKTALWKIITQSESSVLLQFEMNKSEYKAKGFPFSLTLDIKYELNDSGLTCESKVINNGGSAAPFGLGFHPYFTVGTATIDKTQLQYSASKLVEFAPSLKPTGRVIDIPADLNFNRNKQIGDKIIDNCFTDLGFRNGIHQTVVADGKDQSITVWQDESFPYLQLYSADTIGDEHRRRGLAVEPQTCTGFALNMPEMGLRVLEPGQSFSGKWGIDCQT